MNILFVHHETRKYGASRSLLALIDGLREKGVKSYVILPGKGPMVAELESRNIKYYVIPQKFWALRYPIGLVKRIARGCFNLLVSLITGFLALFLRADIIYTNSSVVSTGALSAFFVGKPHIWHVREFGQEDYGISYYWGFDNVAKLMELLSEKIIVISEAVKRKYFEYINHEKIKVVYNPIGVEEEKRYSEIGYKNKDERSSPNNKVVAVLVGTIRPGKGQIDAILALSELIHSGREVYLKIVGGGSSDYLSCLKKNVYEQNIDKYVEFCGYVDDSLPIMQSANMVLVCSRAEAFGRVTIESMITGTPVIGTNTGATPELIKEGFNGLLYEPGNFKQLANKIEYLISHKEEAADMGRNGYNFVFENFTVERYTKAVYEELLNFV